MVATQAFESVWHRTVQSGLERNGRRLNLILGQLSSFDVRLSVSQEAQTVAGYAASRWKSQASVNVASEPDISVVARFG